MSAPILDPAKALHFMLAGNAHMTFVSKRTGARFTYRIQQGKTRAGDTRMPPHFVSVLTGPDAYQYLGCIFQSRTYAHGGAKSSISKDATSSVAFGWVFSKLAGGRHHEELEVWHEGRCGRCGRALTVPESIASGLGPECARRVS
jgi:Family of unknown function (DUF6011)